MSIELLDKNGLSHLVEKIKESQQQFIKSDGSYDEFLMADGSKIKGKELVAQLPTDYLKRGGVVGLNSSSTTKPWFKLLSVKEPNPDQNRNIVLFVHKINAPADACGILSVNVRTDGANAWSEGYLVWEYVGNGIDIKDFVYAHTSEGIGVSEVWVKCEDNWTCYGYEVLFESIGADRNLDAFELENGRSPEGEESPPSAGYTTFTSTIAELQGHKVSPVEILEDSHFLEQLAQDETFISTLAANPIFIEKVKSSIGKI